MRVEKQKKKPKNKLQVGVYFRDEASFRAFEQYAKDVLGNEANAATFGSRTSVARSLIVEALIQKGYLQPQAA